MSNVESLQKQALEQIEKAGNISGIEDVRVHWLGKSGQITTLLKSLGQVSPEERKSLGASYNQLKEIITAAIETKKAALIQLEMNARLAAEKVDVTLAPRPFPTGKIHPVTQVIEEITAIFTDIGFWVAEGPEVEDDEHNFNALNIPPSHPARQMHDTFYLQGKGEHGPLLLRTHTSPVQVRTMRAGKPPFRFIAPGATFRCDSDMTHTPMFHQVEGLVIDKNIHMGHLKGCIEMFLKAFFGIDNLPVRFRPSFFPFTEPSAEVDIGCTRGKTELKVGVGKDWLEIMGCGMVNPAVLQNCGINPDEWQGFAFGMGVERLAMLKYGIPDLRTFFESDQRWLKHYGFDTFDIPNLVAGVAS